MKIPKTTPSELIGTKLIDDWCEINGGGVVTEDQLKEIEKRRKKYEDEHASS